MTVDVRLVHSAPYLVGPAAMQRPAVEISWIYAEKCIEPATTK